MVIADAAMVPAIITAMTSALNLFCAGAARTRSARRTYGGLQRESQATAARTAAAWPPHSTSRMSSAVVKKPATIVSAAAGQEAEREREHRRQGRPAKE